MTLNYLKEEIFQWAKRFAWEIQHLNVSKEDILQIRQIGLRVLDTNEVGTLGTVFSLCHKAFHKG